MWFHRRIRKNFEDSEKVPIRQSRRGWSSLVLRAKNGVTVNVMTGVNPIKVAGCRICAAGFGPPDLRQKSGLLQKNFEGWKAKKIANDADENKFTQLNATSGDPGCSSSTPASPTTPKTTLRVPTAVPFAISRKNRKKQGRSSIKGPWGPGPPHNLANFKKGCRIKDADVIALPTAKDSNGRRRSTVLQNPPKKSKRTSKVRSRKKFKYADENKLNVVDPAAVRPKNFEDSEKSSNTPITTKTS